MMVVGKEARENGCFRPHPHLRSPRFGLLVLLVLLLPMGTPLPVWAADDASQRLQKAYQELRDLSQRNPFGVPLRVQSDEHNDQVSAEVQAIFEHPFDTVKAALSSPASWCEIAPLNVTIKACTHQIQARGTLLTLYIGRKQYQRPQEAASQPYQFMVQAAEPGFLSVSMTALTGLYGTTAHRFQLQAASADGRTLVAMQTSYMQGAATKLATAIYLATLGRDKVGFTREETSAGGQPKYVKGLRGMIERNIMRYYLAIEAFLDTQAMPIAYRFEACLNMAYELMERYPLQLHDLEKPEYFDAKRREREDQFRLQQDLNRPAPPRNAP